MDQQCLLNLPSDEDLIQANKLFETALMLLEQKRPIDKAIKCIQKAITLDDKNYRYWQLLGEAYFHRGSLNPSINSFIKSQNLALQEETEDEDELQAKEFACTHSKLRMSDIRLQAGHLDEAATGYTEIIATNPDHVDALMGLSKTNLARSKQNFSQGLVKSGHVYCMQALTLVLKAIRHANQVSEAWQLASDCCLTQFVAGQRGQFETKLNEELPDSDQGGVIIINKWTCIELAQKFLCKALENAEPSQSHKLWHNIGNCLYFRALMIKADDKSTRDMLLTRAIKSYLKALDLDRNSSQIRNSIGIASYHLGLKNIAQSFLIKSIHTDVNTSEIQYSNLGYIYLNENELDKASAAFDRCQAEEPIYPRSWLGKSLVYEKIAVDNLSYLRHCHRLGNNYDSQLKFASKIVSLPDSNKHSKDKVDALDCMRRIINYDDKSALVWNTLGLIYERSGFINDARRCFELANAIEPINDKIVMNRIRQTYNNECYSDHNETNQGKIDCIKRSQELADEQAVFLQNFIYYLFKNGDYRLVESKLLQLLNGITKQPGQEDIVALASTRMLLGLAKHKINQNSCLFQTNVEPLSRTKSIESVINLTIMMIISCKIDDMQYQKKLANELTSALQIYIESKSQQFDDTFYSKDGYWIKMALFSSIFCLQGQVSLIGRILARHPTVAELWLFKGLENMFSEIRKQDATIYCINKAILIGSMNPDLVFVGELLLCILTVSAQKIPMTIEKRSKFLRQAIFKYPHYDKLRCILDQLSCDAKQLSQFAKKGNLLTGINSDIFSVAMNHVANKLFL